MMTYAETMEYGTAQYADVLAMLEHLGLPATFTQTGGMNAAIEVQLETGHTLLITDAEDSLAWCRADHQGWGVGKYEPGEDRGGAIAFEASDDGSLTALEGMISRVLFA